MLGTVSVKSLLSRRRERRGISTASSLPQKTFVFSHSRSPQAHTAVRMFVDKLLRSYSDC